MVWHADDVPVKPSARRPAPAATACRRHPPVDGALALPPRRQGECLSMSARAQNSISADSSTVRGAATVATVSRALLESQ